MTIDAALARILSLQAAQQFDPHQPRDMPVALPQGTDLHSLEKFASAPFRMRARFKTHTLTDFLGYMNGAGDAEQTAVFIEPDALEALAVIDFGTAGDPLWREHMAELALKPTPLMKALLGLCATPQTQRDVIDFLEDWSEEIEAVTYDRGDEAPVESMTIARAITAFRRVEIKATASATTGEQHMRADRSTFEEIEARATGGQLPTHLRVVSRELYEDTAPRDLWLRVAVRTGGPAPMFSFRMVEADAMKRTLAREIEVRIRGEHALGEGLRIYTGALMAR